MVCRSSRNYRRTLSRVRCPERAQGTHLYRVGEDQAIIAAIGGVDVAELFETELSFEVKNPWIITRTNGHTTNIRMKAPATSRPASSTWSAPAV